MKRTSLLLALAFAIGLPLAAVAHDHVDKPAAPAAPAGPDAAWLAKAKAEYPLKTCVVSDEDLGGPDEGVDYVYRQEGKPDRLVRFCCHDCLKDFNEDPAKYLKKIDEAATAKKK